MPFSLPSHGALPNQQISLAYEQRARADRSYLEANRTDHELDHQNGRRAAGSQLWYWRSLRATFRFRPERGDECFQESGHRQPYRHLADLPDRCGGWRSDGFPVFGGVRSTEERQRVILVQPTKIRRRRYAYKACSLSGTGRQQVDRKQMAARVRAALPKALRTAYQRLTFSGFSLPYAHQLVLVENFLKSLF